MSESKIVASKRLLVANRGEIATRIFRAGTELNMRTIALFSHEDRYSVHRFKADEAYQVGSRNDPLGAYLDWQNIVDLAIEKKIDAIHPGYGFLSENDTFAAACEDNQIMFCGPPSKILRLFGDKIAAKKVAQEAGVNLIPGTDGPVETVEEGLKFAESIGYPVTLKAVSGGGGKGIRFVKDPKELRDAFERARSEAQTSFGRSDIFIEKTLVNPKHIEVQIMGDVAGNYIHLFERDCSIQRRHQKVVEIAPAFGINPKTSEEILEKALKIARHVQYVGVGTVEFLVDSNGESYFLEVNPRVQVEHTVTEMITGIDIVQSSIMLPAGRTMDHPAIGIKDQSQVKKRGVAIQCRVTTEDPKNNFQPDIGKIVAYRPAQGFGVRLDEGLATSGGIVTPYYDSLLVKVTTHSLDLYGTARKMRRALKEFRIRGVKHNIPLLVNIVSHPKFIEGKFSTNFLTECPEVFEFTQPRDRATKLLKFIGSASLNNPHNLPDKTVRGEFEAPPPNGQTLPLYEKKTAKEIFDEGGVKKLTDWILENPKLLLTDTTMRDAHQSLFATRLRSFDILKATDFYHQKAAGFFSLEVWGGATFDTCMRFLKEDPWERLYQLRQRMPRTLLQMLLRGDNAVGYTNYPEWVIRDFIRLTVETGLDLFRIFDCLNNPSQMSVAIDEVKKRGGIVEASLCYSGNITDPTRTKYTLDYYLKLAKELQTMGTDILAIKDMAGLLRPKAAEILVKALKEETGLPIHLHTHATSGSSVATLLAAQKAGCDIVDGAVSSMAGLTSQPSLNAVVASLEGDSSAPEVSLNVLDELGPYWESIRSMYQVFDPGINASSTRVYEHEIPGGQYSNLFDQARKVGVTAAEFYSLTDRYKEVNHLLGDIVKVTPSSKVVGDFALLLQKNKISADQLLNEDIQLDYPDSVISFFKGEMGIPYGGFPEDIRKKVLGSNLEIQEKPEHDPSDTFHKAKKDLTGILGDRPTDQQVLSYRLYPKVYKEFMNHLDEYGRVDNLPTQTFLYGLQSNSEIQVQLEEGKTLLIRLNGFSEPDHKGNRRMFFELNGFPRELEIQDESAKRRSNVKLKADPNNSLQIPAPMPGKVLEIKIKVGDQVSMGDILIVTESMKMEYALSAKSDGKVKSIVVAAGDQLEEGDLLCELE